MSYKIEIKQSDGNITEHIFETQIAIIIKFGLAERSIRTSIKEGRFIKGKEYEFRVSEIYKGKDNNDVKIVDKVNDNIFKTYGSINTGSIIRDGNIKLDLTDLTKTLNEITNKYESTYVKKSPIINKDIYKAVLFSDYHYPYFDKGCSKAFKDFINDNKNIIDELVDVGDGADCGALSTHLHLEDEKMDLYKELEGYAEFTKDLKSILGCKMTVLSDNHYTLRMKRYLAQNPAMKNMIREIDFGYDEKVSHGVPYFPLREYGQNKIAGIHGINCSDNFTKSLTTDYNFDMFQGHAHSIQVYHNKNTKTAYGLPCMCKLEMAYMLGRAHRWRQGWSVLSWYPKEDRYTLDIIEYKDGKAIYKDKVYKGDI